MRSIWNEADRRDLMARVDNLSPNSRARWGRMTAPRMLVHMNDGFRMALGDFGVTVMRTPLRFTPLKQLVVYVLPFPRGAPTAPELLKSDPVDWSQDVIELKQLMERFVAERNKPAREWGQHPLFGKLSPRAWGVLGYKHMDHHLRQFGV